MALRLIKYEDQGAGMAAVFEDDRPMIRIDDLGRTVAQRELAFIKSSLEMRIANLAKGGFDTSAEQAALDGWPVEVA